MIFFTAIYIFKKIIAAIYIQLAVRHNMPFAVRDMYIQREDRVMCIFVFYHF